MESDLEARFLKLDVHFSKWQKTFRVSLNGKGEN
jgi:hypothetical protein